MSWKKGSIRLLITYLHYTHRPCPWSGGCPVDTGALHPAEQPSQSCSRWRPRANSSGCWSSLRSGPATGSAGKAALRRQNAGTTRRPSGRPCWGAAARRSPCQGVLGRRGGDMHPAERQSHFLTWPPNQIRRLEAWIKCVAIEWDGRQLL